MQTDTNRGMQSIESFRGRIETESDCIVLIDLARRGIIPRVQRRLTDRERREIRHGSVFVYWEEESRIRRWTDGMSWTPSRVQGVFLVYKQLLHTSPMVKKTYSAVCSNMNFHIVGYYHMPHSPYDGLLSVSAVYRGLVFPSDIRMRRKSSFIEKQWTSPFLSSPDPDATVFPETCEDRSDHGYWDHPAIA